MTSQTPDATVPPAVAAPRSTGRPRAVARRARPGAGVLGRIRSQLSRRVNASPVAFLLGGLLLGACTPPHGPVEPVTGIVLEDGEGDGTTVGTPARGIDVDAPPGVAPEAVAERDTAAPAATEAPATDATEAWRSLAPGLERRHAYRYGDDGRVVERLYVLRADPALVRLDIAYAPGEARSLDQWLEATGALAVVNGGYFTEELHATGLLIADGERHGASYGGFAGMLAIDESGMASLRWLRQQPYDAAEPLRAALQSFPLLVHPGGVHGFPEDGGLPSRRTVVAVDGAGRFLFLVAPGGSFSLHALATWLVESELDVDVALNLDGGTSSGVLVADPPEGTPAFVLLPSVIALHPR